VLYAWAVIADVTYPLGMFSRKDIPGNVPSEPSLAVLGNPLSQFTGALQRTVQKELVKNSFIGGIAGKSLWGEFGESLHIAVFPAFLSGEWARGDWRKAEGIGFWVEEIPVVRRTLAVRVDVESVPTD
jgi:hypothetical protein